MSSETGRTRVACASLAFGIALFASGLGASPRDDDSSASGGREDDGSRGCLACHERIEDMHPEAELSCVDCHGGDATATSVNLAHVRTTRAARAGTGDERVAPLDEDLAYARFVNPMDLRVVDRTCGECHQDECDSLRVSLHGTTAGHLSDGYYEMGLHDERGSRYGVFAADDPPREGGDLDRVLQVPPYSDRYDEQDLRRHYTDLARKECMQCHLYSEGRAVRGRIGFDGDYRGDGCAACHVEYALDGLSESRDGAIERNEPGHPRAHVMTTSPTTQTCTSCHYGDASIGLHFRGLSQLPPGAPSGPDIPGTTDVRLNTVFYLDDPSMVPPDVHHERGMHCIDCHTFSDVMGDGKMHGQMEHAVEITCESCHGTFDSRATLRTENGAPLEHLRWRDDELVLTSKVTGEEHLVPQATEVVDRAAWTFNPHAIGAMDDVHAELECYTCHAGWNVNFLGFHFSRNESLSQLDLLSGRTTPGRVTTQDKVFATWKSFYAGLNEKGKVAPYLTGFSTMGSVWDEDGELILDQVMPETAAGLSGMSMIHHQLHSTRPTARSCVECHRSSATWGMGSPNFRLARQLAFVADRRGIELVALNRNQLSGSVPLGKVVLPDVIDLELATDPLQGHARTLFATEGGRGVHAIDVSVPARPERVDFAATINPRGMELVGEHLLVADGIGGLRIFDVSDPEELELVSVVPMFDAHAVSVSWPWAYVADGPGGLVIVDIRAPIAPRIVGGIDVNGGMTVPNETTHVAHLFQYSRPIAEDGVPTDMREEARAICAVLDASAGLVMIDVTEPAHPRVLNARDRNRSGSGRGNNGVRGSVAWRGLALQSHVDLAEAQGGSPTRERDYAYALVENANNGNARVMVFDVTYPHRPQPVGEAPAGQEGEMLAAINVYNPPFLERVLLAPGGEGVLITDASTSAEPSQSGFIPAIRSAYVVAVEEFPLDRMIDPNGRRLKDVSHEGSRWLYRSEIERLLDVDGVALGTLHSHSEPEPLLGATARLHLDGMDDDGDGLLSGEDEMAGAGGAAADANGDRRITLIELAAYAGILEAPLDGDRSATMGMGMEMEEEPAFLTTRTDADGDLSRLFDGVSPYEFDRDGDDELSREETERALFAALDLNGDDRISPDEMSRHPGRFRQIRYGDALAEELFDEVDRNGDGKVTQRELSVQDRDWLALDLDGNGGIQLPTSDQLSTFEIERGVVRGRTEWPTRRRIVTALPPIITADRVLEVFDRDRDDALSRSELKKRPDLWAELYGSGPFAGGGRDGDRPMGEGIPRRVLEDRIARVIDLGVEASADDFQTRWDLDGDGEVTADDLPDVPVVRLRDLTGERR